MRRLGVIALVTGCNALIGAHEFAPLDAVPEAPLVTVHVTRQLAENNAMFAPVVTAQAIVPSKILFEDGTQATLTMLPDGGVAFPAPAGARYAVYYCRSIARGRSASRGRPRSRARSIARAW